MAEEITSGDLLRHIAVRVCSRRPATGKVAMRASVKSHSYDAARLSGRAAFLRCTAVAAALSLAVSGCGGDKKKDVGGGGGKPSASGSVPENPIASEPMEH